MLFSHTSSYAIRALAYLAMQPPGKLSGTKEISAHEGIPTFFLSKVLLQLRRARLVRSFKGIGGGYQLALPPDQVNLLMVLRSTSGEELLEGCILENRPCSSPRHCALHDAWVGIRDQIQKLLERKTLADLARVRQTDLEEEKGHSAGLTALPDQ